MRFDTLFQTIDRVTVIQVYQNAFSGDIYTHYVAGLEIKHYDSVVLLDQFSIDRGSHLFPGNSPGAIIYNCDKRGAGQIILSNGIVIQTTLSERLGNTAYTVQITVPDNFRNKGLWGVCGNFNGNSGDESYDLNYGIFDYSSYYNFLYNCKNGCSAFNNAPLDPNSQPVPPGNKCTVGARPNNCQNLVEVTSFVTTC